MSGINRNGWTAYALAIAVIAADQLTKLWIVAGWQVGDSRPALGPIWFTRIWNEGMSFGLLQARHGFVRWGFVLFAFGVAALLCAWAAKQARLLPAVGLGLVVGGAVGNAIDRIRFGAVVDFIDVTRLLPFFPWVFNVADSGVTVGVILLLADSLRRERPA